jgi:hypothetical protein
MKAARARFGGGTKSDLQLVKIDLALDKYLRK